MLSVFFADGSIAKNIYHSKQSKHLGDAPEYGWYDMSRSSSE